MNIVGIYAGSFDPITIGHIDIIKRSLSFCDDLIIGVGNNPAKKTLLDAPTRVQLINEVLDNEINDRYRVTTLSFDGLLVDFVKKYKAQVLIRGIRSVSDFEYEINLSNINRTLYPKVETIFLPTSPNLAVISSSMVKEIANHYGDVSPFVHPIVKKHLTSIFSKD